MKRAGDRVIARDRVIGEAAYICLPERGGAYATASRRIPAMSVPKHPVSGSSCEIPNLPAETRMRVERSISPRRHGGTEKIRAGFSILVKLTNIIRAVLSEIFDESAYDRFLLRTNAGRSIASYRAFTRERDAAMLKKPRCC
jgi:hypothetical protein